MFFYQVFYKMTINNALFIHIADHTDYITVWLNQTKVSWF